MSVLNVVKKTLMFSYGLFIVLVTIGIVTAISFAIKFVLEKYTSLNTSAVTAITVISGLVLFFALITPTFFGVGFGFLGSFSNALFPDFD